MSADPNKLKKFAIEMMAKFRMLDTELQACKTVLHGLELDGRLSDLEECLSAARDLVKDQMNSKYDGIQEAIAKQSDESTLEGISQWFQLLKVEGPIN